jgi:hypothetical protein
VEAHFGAITKGFKALQFQPFEFEQLSIPSREWKITGPQAF